VLVARVAVALVRKMLQLLLAVRQILAVVAVVGVKVIVVLAVRVWLFSVTSQQTQMQKV
jgi:hypothetical protein